MMRTRMHLLLPLLAAAVLALAQAAAPRPARAADITHAWGISTVGETCDGRCSRDNLCCRIVIILVPPDS
jgi:hypothetical protein